MELGHFTYQRGSRKYLLALTRPCMCTQTEGLHRWTEACDRFPPLLAEIDGKEVEPNEVETLIASPGTAPIQPAGGLTPAQEYAYLVASKEFTHGHKADINTIAPIF